MLRFFPSFFSLEADHLYKNDVRFPFRELFEESCATTKRIFATMYLFLKTTAYLIWKLEILFWQITMFIKKVQVDFVLRLQTL